MGKSCIGQWMKDACTISADCSVDEIRRSAMSKHCTSYTAPILLSTHIVIIIITIDVNILNTT